MEWVGSRLISQGSGTSNGNTIEPWTFTWVNGFNLATNSQNLPAFGHLDTNITKTATACKILLPYDCIITNAYGLLSASPGVGATSRFVLGKNSNSTGGNIILDFVASTTASDLTNVGTFAAGDVLWWTYISNRGGSPSGTVTVSLAFKVTRL